MKAALRIFFLIVTLLAVKAQAFAAKVPFATAQVTAINFYRLNAQNTDARNVITAALKYTQTENDGTVDFYVFDMSPAKGFVIISADDQLMPVIGYSFECNFKLPTKNRAVQTWMNHAGTHIYSAIQRHTMANAKISGQWSAYLQGVKPAGAKSTGTGVSPLLSTNWDQEPYYNQLCPYSTTDSQRTLTGCVATTMAQIMKYWNYPQQGIGSYGYNDVPPSYTFNYGNQYANFGATTYNWAAMPDTLSGNNLSVATLMYHCGVAVAMNYGDDNQGGSGAFVLSSEVPSWHNSAQMAYSTYFGYNASTITGVKELNYSAAAWVSLMETELNAGRPIQYEGTDPNEGGHTWVCDGYDANDFLHMNWGWGGFDNGYFSVSCLSADDYNFSTKEAALIGIQPLSGLTVTASATSPGICRGSSTIISAQGSGNVSSSWLPVTGLVCSTCASTVANPDTTTTYTITIDSAGFSASSSITILVSNVRIDSFRTANVNCFGNGNGGAKVVVSGGNEGYNFLWSTGSTNASVPNLVAGNYSVTVTDGVGCSSSAAVAITQPDSLIAVFNAANNACSLNNATLSVNAFGGTPSYSYAWAGGQNIAVLSPLSAGIYVVTITDANGCSASSSYVIQQPAPVNVSIISSNTACSLLYATATANVTGGHENFSFAWNTGDNTPSISNLSAGTYFVTVTDSLGCTSSDSLFLSQPDSMNVSIATSITAVNEVYGKAIAKVTGGAPQYSFLWNTGDTTEAISYATPGIYAVTITDSKGCAQTAAAQIKETTDAVSIGNNLAFEVYPNPAATQVTIRLNATNEEEANIEVKNVLGQAVFATRMQGMETRIDLSEFSNGVYFVVMSAAGQTGIKEVIVKK